MTICLLYLYYIQIVFQRLHSASDGLRLPVLYQQAQKICDFRNNSLTLQAKTS